MLKKIMHKLNKDSLSIIVAVVAIVIVGVLVFGGSNPTVNKVLSSLNLGMSSEAIAKKSIEHLNKNVLQNGQTAVLVNYSQESGLVKMTIKIGESSYDSYATKDGKLLFPQALQIGQSSSDQVAADQNQAGEPVNVKPADLKKADKPMLDVYVVSRCPFGLQIQRAVAEAARSIPAITASIKIRYIGSVAGNTITAMHGEAEAKENLRQICIREEQQSKYWPYVDCQMKTANSEGTCATSTGINMTKLNACIADTARGVAYAQDDFTLGAKFNVQGSPTLILNEQQISEFDFGGRSAETMKKLICEASTTAPEFCSTKLSEAQAATSFSTTYSTEGSGASGSVAVNSDLTNCAPAQ